MEPLSAALRGRFVIMDDLHVAIHGTAVLRRSSVPIRLLRDKGASMQGGLVYPRVVRGLRTFMRCFLISSSPTGPIGL